MKKFLLALCLSTTASAQIALPDFGVTLKDIRTTRQSSQSLFENLNRDLVKTKSSICSNRALIWNYDFTRFYGIDSAKLFLFYTGKNGTVGRTTWWYHVTPVVNEGHKLMTIDGGFPGWINEPLSIEDWFTKFVGDANCKEIRAGEDDLIELMFKNRVFPGTTRYGTYSCYYIVAPKEFWTPATVAHGLLGRDENNNPVNTDRSRFIRGELQQACVEAASSTFGGIFGGPKKKCEKYLSWNQL